jgi:FHA domain
MPEVNYIPGSMTAIVGDGRLALIDGPPDSPAVALIWQQFGQQARVITILSGLLGAGFAGAESFVLLAQGEDGQLRLFCRGTVGATALGGAVPAWFDGAGLSTWSEHLIGDDVTRVVVGEPTADRPWCLPASAGVLLAECVIIDLAVSAAGDGSPPPAAAASPGGGAFLDAAGALPDTETLRTIRLHSQSARQATAGESRAEELAPADDPAADDPADDQPADDRPAYDQPADDRPAYDQPADDRPAYDQPAYDQPAYDQPAYLSGDDLPANNLPANGIPTGEIPAPQAAADPGPPAGLVFDDRGTVIVQDPGPSGTADLGGSWELPVAPLAPLAPFAPIAPVAPPSPAFAPALPALPAPSAPPLPPDRSGPLVPTLICPSGHANPPTGGACRWCGAPLPLDPVLIPRPVLGVLRLSLGDVITLDRGVIMGRNPSADFDADDSGERPQVVKLPTEDGDISRTHLRVILDGWRVLVTDLNSTNGTLIALPGREPERIRPGEPMPIVPGTVVILADGIDFRYEVTGPPEPAGLLSHSLSGALNASRGGPRTCWCEARNAHAHAAYRRGARDHTAGGEFLRRQECDPGGIRSVQRPCRHPDRGPASVRDCSVPVRSPGILGRAVGNCEACGLSRAVGNWEAGGLTVGADGCPGHAVCARIADPRRVVGPPVIRPRTFRVGRRDRD